MTNIVFERIPVDVRKTAMSTLFILGVGLSGAGTYLHLNLSGRMQAGACDGCDPWHPLFVVTPLLAGAVLLLTACLLLLREYGD
jgi:hypothetical protein